VASSHASVVSGHAGEPSDCADAAPGRMCPADYRYDPSVFDRPCEIRGDVLYVIGGSYGNTAALDLAARMRDSEHGDVTMIFNGDFHWFDAEPAWFAEVDNRVAGPGAVAMRGNVETEISRLDDIGAGCGCAYPETVSDHMVVRSNEMLRDLRATADELAARPRLAALPMHLMAEVGGLRIAVVHGDAAALAGWRFAPDALDDPANRPWLAAVQARSRVDIFASTHTCLAALRNFDLPAGTLTVINNGAAGMPNFAGTRFGLISRIATRPARHVPLYGTVRDGVFIDALPVLYDDAAFLGRFLARWPARSSAHTSYFGRIMNGPDHAVATARPRG